MLKNHLKNSNTMIEGLAFISESQNAWIFIRLPKKLMYLLCTTIRGSLKPLVRVNKRVYSASRVKSDFRFVQIIIFVEHFLI